MLTVKNLEVAARRHGLHLGNYKELDPAAGYSLHLKEGDGDDVKDFADLYEVATALMKYDDDNGVMFDVRIQYLCAGKQVQVGGGFKGLEAFGIHTVKVSAGRLFITDKNGEPWFFDTYLEEISEPTSIDGGDTGGCLTHIYALDSVQ
jgi:hypothetical protein